MANSQDKNDLAKGIEDVQRDIARHPAGNHELTLLALHPAANQRVRSQHVDTIENLLDRRVRVVRRNIAKELPESYEILDGLRRMDYSRHLMGLGRGGFFPAALARSHFATSSCA